MSFITQFLIPSIVLGGLLYVVYHQYKEQGRRHEQRKADKAAQKEAEAN